MSNTGLEEAQTGIKIAGRNISNLRYADDTTLHFTGSEEQKSLLRKMKEEPFNTTFIYFFLILFLNFTILY